MKPNTLLVPALPFSKTEVDPQFERDVQVVTGLGWSVIRLDFEQLLDNKKVVIYGKQSAVISPVLYRGWMLSVDDYRVLYEAVADIGLELVTSPEQYANGHTLPGWYQLFEDFTPRSWHGQDLENAEYPAIVKDYVKSAKHLWDEACYIPDEVNKDKVINRFKQERGDQFEGGLVLREYVPDLTGVEARTWWWEGQLILITHHPDSPDELVAEVPTEDIADAVQQLDAVFVSVDFAERDDGSWVVIEVGDGGVSDYPQSLSIAELYKRMQ